MNNFNYPEFQPDLLEADLDLSLLDLLSDPPVLFPRQPEGEYGAPPCLMDPPLGPLSLQPPPPELPRQGEFRFLSLSKINHIIYKYSN